MISFAVAITCFAGPPDEQHLVGRWKTRENIDLVFTKEHTFTMKSPDLPRGAAGKWLLHADGQLEMVVTAELNASMQQKPVAEQKIPGQKLTASGRDIIQVNAPGGSTDTWTRTNAPNHTMALTASGRYNLLSLGLNTYPAGVCLLAHGSSSLSR